MISISFVSHSVLDLGTENMGLVTILISCGEQGLSVCICEHTHFVVSLHAIGFGLLLVIESNLECLYRC
jgi:hypothetical protein